MNRTQQMLGIGNKWWQVVLAAAIALATGTMWAQSQGATPPPEKPGEDIMSLTDPLKTSKAATPEAKFNEDFSTPSLEGSNLKPVEAFVEQNDNYDANVELQLIRVMWRPGDPIDLYIMKPPGLKKPPVILYLYTYPTEGDRYQNRTFQRELVRNGFAGIGFVGPLTGQRYHDVPMKEWFVRDLKESLAISAHDVQMILNYLDRRGDMDMDHVGMFGEGSGASIAILAAAADPRIKTLDLIDPWGDWPDWIAKSKLIPEKERPDYLKPEFLAGVAPLDPVKWLPELKTQKIRLRDVKSDTTNPEETRQKIEAVAPSNAHVIRYDDNKALYSDISGGRGLDWVKQKTSPGSTLPQYQAAGKAGSSSKPKSSQQ